ncbi:MAG: hypothetical protein ACPL8I_13600 [Chloroflexaceae bacterium]
MGFWIWNWVCGGDGRRAEARVGASQLSERERRISAMDHSTRQTSMDPRGEPTTTAWPSAAAATGPPTLPTVSINAGPSPSRR